MRLLLAAMFALFCAPGFATSQTADESSTAYDIECPGGLNSYFQLNREPVHYRGEEWVSQWFASSPERPLPSRTWYYAYPDRDLISLDNTAFWQWAEIKVHCWIYQSLYITVRHYDPIDFGGYVRMIPSDPSGEGCGGGDYTTSYYYDPYDPGSGCDGSDGTGGSAGGGSAADPTRDMTFPELCSSLGGKLYYDYLCLEQWNEKTGSYETIWCGTAAICET
jgi:hypothetical protein